MYIIMALSAGVLVIVSISINGHLARKVGLVQSGMTNYIVGLMASLVFYLIVYRSFSQLTFQHLSSAPWYFYLGGAVGSFIIIMNNLLINRISAVYVTVIVFLGQMTTGILIDYLNLHVFSKGKIIGGVLIVAGLLYYISGDKKAEVISEMN